MKKFNKKLELKKETITILDNLQASKVLGGGEGGSSMSWLAYICCFSMWTECKTTCETNTEEKEERNDE